MNKDAALNLTLEKFSEIVTTELKEELIKAEMPIEKVYELYLKMAKNSECEKDEDIEDINSYVKNLVTDYIEELLYRTFRSYEFDWE